jgi:uncharacterized membrane protein
VIFFLIAGLAGGLGLILFFSALAGGAMGVNAAVSGVLTATVPVIFSFFADALPRPPQARGRRAGTLSGRKLWLTILALAGLSGILDAGGNLCYSAAALAGRLDVAAVLSSLYPATTIVLAMWLLRERVERSQTFGMLLALSAVVLISV